MATIRKLPNGRFRADIRKNYTFIQAKTFSLKKDAEKWSSDFDAKLDQILSLSPSEVSNLTPDQVETLGGREVFSKLGIELDFLTFHELVDEYISKWNKKDENQIPRAAYWQEIFNKKPIKAITSADVRKALDQYGKGKILKGHGPGKSVEINKQRSSNTVLRQKAFLSSIFKYAIKRGYLNDNPAEGVSVDSTPNEVERFLDDREREALLEACKKSTCLPVYLDDERYTLSPDLVCVTK
jgi:hypothetical protein